MSSTQCFPVLCVTTSLCHSHGCKNSSLDPQYNLASSDLRGANGMEWNLRDSIVQIHSSVWVTLEWRRCELGSCRELLTVVVFPLKTRKQTKPVFTEGEEWKKKKQINKAERQTEAHKIFHVFFLRIFPDTLYSYNN